MRRFTSFSALAIAIALPACSDSAGPAEPAGPTMATVAVDASAGWAYLDFTGSSAVPVTVNTPSSSTSWDLGINATNIVINGGSIGPAGAVAHCICQNAGATNAQVMAFTATDQLAAFEAVTAGQIPAGAAAWSADVFTTSKWYRYNLTGSDHQVWPTFEVYLIKIGTDVYKVQLTNYYGPGGEPRRISLRYAKLR